MKYFQPTKSLPKFENCAAKIDLKLWLKKIAKETSKFLVDGINLNNVVPKGKNKTNDEKELSYRCGADGFFGGFVDNFFLNLPLTYQQFIGTNREQSYL